MDGWSRHDSREGCDESNIPLPVEKSPCRENSGVEHPFVVYCCMIAEQTQLLGLVESMLQIDFADFIHAVVVIDEIQERGSLHGNQIYFGTFQLPQAYRFG